MRLTELEPRFLKRIDDNHFRSVDRIEDADGVRFLCPKCFQVNGGARGTHGIMCWSPSVPQTTAPTPGRWNLVGTGMGDLTLVAGSSSISLTSGCQAHFFIENGNIRMA